MKLTTKEAAAYLGISLYYLRNMRHLLHNHDGPTFEKAKHARGTACYYETTELDRWKHNHSWREHKRKKDN